MNYLRGNREHIYPRMDGFAAEIGDHVNSEARRSGVLVCAKQAGPAVQLFAGVSEMKNLHDITASAKQQTRRFTAELLGLGIHTLPRGLMYLSTAHTEADIAETKKAITGAIDCFRAARSKDRPGNCLPG